MSDFEGIDDVIICAAREFEAASKKMKNNRWVGIDLEKRIKLDELSEKAVYNIIESLNRKSLELERMHGAQFLPHELDELLIKQKKEMELYEKLLEIVPEDEKLVTSKSGEFAKFEEKLKEINWPVRPPIIVPDDSTDTAIDNREKN